MENYTKEISERLLKLPKKVRDVVVYGDWHSKLAEIGKKYSLGVKQVDDLGYEVLFVLVGMETQESLSKNIIKQLSVSSLLAGELYEELDKKVFAYIADMAEKEGAPSQIKTKPVINQDVQAKPQKVTIVEKKNSIVLENDTPEIRPEITPMIEPGEKVHVLTPTAPKPPISESIPQKSVLNQRPPVVSNNEPIQKPVSVPRYTGESIINTQIPKPPEPVAPAVKKYVVDPYREPLT